MHATILGVAVSLLGVRVGWEVPDDRSVVYVVQLDADDLDRFRTDRLIESDVPPQVKNIRRLRIELATRFSSPPRQDSLPKEEPPPRSPSPSSSPSPEAPKRQTERSFGTQTKLPGPGAAKTDDWLLPPDERKELKEKQAALAAKSGPEAKSGKQGESPSHGAAASRPWLPPGVALCGSLGANLYFFWMWMDARGRYRRLLQRQRGERTNDERQMTKE
jgi:hypothetical protein